MMQSAPGSADRDRAAIATRLRERLSGDAAKPAVKGGTRHPEAYELYLKANYYFEQRTRCSQWL